jgi:hypothetical protein
MRLIALLLGVATALQTFSAALPLCSILSFNPLKCLAPRTSIAPSRL